MGLAVMGQNLALNIANNGFPIAVYNRTVARTHEFLAGPAHGTAIRGAETLEGFVESLASPRTIIMMVQAGAAVDAVLQQLRPLLSAGDIVIDGGNSLYRDTIRRGQELADTGIQYVGMGVSGGEEGALKGPSLMPGGPRAAYDHLAPILTQIAAQTDDGACVSYIGQGGGGHYVKMVHNGIEYGDMQLIAEAYDLLRRTQGLSARDLAAIFAEWNQGELQSYLIEITADVLAYVDPDSKQPLVDVILDASGQKGTGKWTSQDALDLGVPIPTIDAAVWSRNISALKAERVHAAGVLPGSAAGGSDSKPGDGFVGQVRDALYAAKIVAYAQGMALLREASREYDFGLDLAEVARIWKGGCIIRAALLDQIKAAFRADPDLTNLLLHPPLAAQVGDRLAAWRQVATTARRSGIPCPALSASLDYYDTYRYAHMPANLIQAQRDYFGAHTYQRTDQPGVFHTEWQRPG